MAEPIDVAALHQQGWPDRDYICECATCGKQFAGHKREITCRICEEAKPPLLEVPGSTWLRDGRLLYTLQPVIHEGRRRYTKGEPLLCNRLMVRVEGHDVPPSELEALLDRLEAFLNG